MRRCKYNGPELGLGRDVRLLEVPKAPVRLPTGADQCGFLLRAQRDVGCGFVNEAGNLFAVFSASRAVLRFLLEEHLAAHYLIFPFAIVTAGNTPPV